MAKRDHEGRCVLGGGGGALHSLGDALLVLVAGHSVQSGPQLTKNLRVSAHANLGDGIRTRIPGVAKKLVWKIGKSTLAWGCSECAFVLLPPNSSRSASGVRKRSSPEIQCSQLRQSPFTGCQSIDRPTWALLFKVAANRDFG
jgi:hypothetical protein